MYLKDSPSHTCDIFSTTKYIKSIERTSGHMDKIDPYKIKERYFKWKKKTESGISEIKQYNYKYKLYITFNLK